MTKPLLIVGLVSVFLTEASDDYSSSKSAASFSFDIILMRAYRALGSLRISSKGETFFLGLVEGLIALVDVEAGASASSAFYTGVVILSAGEAVGDGNSLMTLLIIDCV